MPCSWAEKYPKIKICFQEDSNPNYRHFAVGLIDWPGARIDHRSSGSVQVVSKFWISFVHVSGKGIAAIQFNIVDLPVCKSVGISFQMAQDSRIASAGKVPVILVDPELQSFIVDLKINNVVNVNVTHFRFVINCLHNLPEPSFRWETSEDLLAIDPVGLFCDTASNHRH